MKFKKITALFLSALFIVNIMPMSAFASNGTTETPPVMPRDSGTPVYKYYDSLPFGWPDFGDENSGWTTEDSRNELIYASLPLMYMASSQISAAILRQCPELPGWFASMIADGVRGAAIAGGIAVTSFNLSVTHLRNNSKAPYQYLNYYTFSASLGGETISENVFEWVTIN